MHNQDISNTIKNCQLNRHFSLIIETAQAPECNHCHNLNKTIPRQRVQFQLQSELIKYAGVQLSVWKTNQTHQFLQLSNIIPAKNTGIFTLDIDPDCIYTVTSTRGQSKGIIIPPPSGSFPLPYFDDFQSTITEHPGRYFADQCGSFQVADIHGNKVLRQVVSQEAGVNRWAMNSPWPITTIGNVTWSDYSVSIDVSLMKTIHKKKKNNVSFVMLCARTSFIGIGKAPTALCLNASIVGIDGNVQWSLIDNTAGQNKILAQGNTLIDVEKFHRLNISVSYRQCNISLDGRLLTTQTVDDSSGMVVLGSGWHQTDFDNFSIKSNINIRPTVSQNAFVLDVLKKGRKRTDYNGLCGMYVRAPKSGISLYAVGRTAFDFADHVHNISVFDHSGKLLSGVNIDMKKNQKHIDGASIIYKNLSKPIFLGGNEEFFVVSMENTNSDSFLDWNTAIKFNSTLGIVLGGSYWCKPPGSGCDNKWHIQHSSTGIYGPVSFQATLLE